MKKKAGLVLAVACFIAAFLLAGCAGPIHQIERAGLVQLTSPASINARPGGKYVLLNCRDSTGLNLNYQGKATRLLRDKGKGVVDSLKSADYAISANVASLSYRKDYRSGGAGATIGAILLGGLAGGLTGGLTGSPGWGLGAAAIGSAAGAAIGYQLDRQVAPGIVTAKVHIRVDERINFIGERRTSLPEPIQKYRKVRKTLKSGKKIWVREKITETEEAETPIRSTVAAARSGSGTATVVTDRRVAKFIPHQAEYEVGVVVERTTTLSEIKQRLEDKVAAIVAGVL